MEDIITKEFTVKIIQDFKQNNNIIAMKNAFILENETDDMFNILLFCLDITKSLSENKLNVTERFPFKTNFPLNKIFNEHLVNIMNEIIYNKIQMEQNFKDLTNK